MRRYRARIGWTLMGYPDNWPGWSLIYRLGGRLHDRWGS